jgi:hypothetical protein
MSLGAFSCVLALVGPVAVELAPDSKNFDYFFGFIRVL